MKSKHRGARRIPGFRSVIALSMLAYSAAVTAELTYFQDLIVPSNITNPGGAPSTVDARIYLLPQYDMFTSGVAGSSYDPYFARLNLDGNNYDVRTLAIPRAVVELQSFGASRSNVTLSNAVLANPSLIVGDSTREAYAALIIGTSVTLQSFGFAYLGYPLVGGGRAEGVIRLRNGGAWFHNGYIGVGDLGGAGSLQIYEGEVSGGLGANPNVFIGGNRIATQIAHQPDMPWELRTLQYGRLFANELTIEGRARADGLVDAAVARIQNGGVAEFRNLDTSSLNIGLEGSGTAMAAGFAGNIDLGSGAGNVGALKVGGTLVVGAADTGWYLTSLAAGAWGGTGEITVAKRSFDGALMQNDPNYTATLNVNGAVTLADTDSRAVLRVTDGGRMTTTGSIHAARYGNAQATILIEGQGSKLTTPELWLAANDSTLFYGNSGPGASGSGRLTIRDGGVLEIVGRTETYQSFTPMGMVDVVNHYPGRLVIGPDGTLDGSGSVLFSGPAGGAARVMGTISPGNSPGWLTIGGDLRLEGPEFGDSHARLLIELGGNEPGSGYDVLEVLGNLALFGATLEISLVNGFMPGAGASFQFLRVHGGITGSFASLVDHTGLGLTLAGLAFDGGNVSLSVAAVPEPETYALFVAGLLLVGGYARRRRTPDFSSALSRRDTRRDRRA